ncbi:hypothetical protein FB45DRAFT_863284 [Roridomyces roridus]|uniref:Uncharacterized protein n=1 Tax=Roridomyces roridus TaxID=1738132 RepID=A0AAD7C979_9AGAR|nr:hypothetical protein FB45DRAFT_863284 [Roridomyces roridus]
MTTDGEVRPGDIPSILREKKNIQHRSNFSNLRPESNGEAADRALSGEPRVADRLIEVAKKCPSQNKRVQQPAQSESKKDDGLAIIWLQVARWDGVGFARSPTQGMAAGTKKTYYCPTWPMTSPGSNGVSPRTKNHGGQTEASRTILKAIRHATRTQVIQKKGRAPRVHAMQTLSGKGISWRVQKEKVGGEERTDNPSSERSMCWDEQSETSIGLGGSNGSNEFSIVEHNLYFA